MNCPNNTTSGFDNSSRIPAPQLNPFILATTWFTVIACALSLLGNGLVLFLFVRTRALRTSFNIYIANVAAAEIIYGICGIPVQFANQYYNYWPYGFGWCSFLEGGATVAGASIRQAHMLMTLNRMWAILQPHSYNQQHTWKMALFFILLTWGLVAGANKVSPLQVASRKRSRGRTGNGSNRVFVYVSIAVTLCWSSTSAFWILADHTGYWDETYYGLQTCITYANSVLNPVLCFVAMEKYRLALKKCYPASV
ncbi:alpha-2 adrenergic receptor-like [Paramacrobiotus metropolitanus]|uniref:alpha-2 adrenergic receptor-like n=1 Tax=Paramacrobiotus metropolitanus TaxID=2943436 RepID=UPI00244572ED|nr:alpha-2 adrenergic receptor-like [Paramacrobiotus metropolitanus]